MTSAFTSKNKGEKQTEPELRISEKIFQLWVEANCRIAKGVLKERATHLTLSRLIVTQCGIGVKTGPLTKWK